MKKLIPFVFIIAGATCLFAMDYKPRFMIQTEIRACKREVCNKLCKHALRNLLHKHSQQVESCRCIVAGRRIKLWFDSSHFKRCYK